MTFREQHQPITARIDTNHTYNYALKHKEKLNSVSSVKKTQWHQCMNSISPWPVDDYNSRNSQHRSQNKKKKTKRPSSKLLNWKTIPTKNKAINYEQNITILNFDGDNLKLSNKKRTKTQAQTNTSFTKIRLNTIQVSNNLHMIPSQKYYSEDYPQRKMSMHKLRETFLKTSRSKAPNNNMNFIQTRSDIEKKVQQKMLSNMYTPSQQKNGQIINKRLKTIQNQNQCPLMFFFEAKNSRNMMQRQKNIMKIRNLSKKANRVKTDGIAVQ